MDYGLPLPDWTLLVVIRLARVAGTGSEEVPGLALNNIVHMFLWADTIHHNHCSFLEKRSGAYYWKRASRKEQIRALHTLHDETHQPHSSFQSRFLIHRLIRAQVTKSPRLEFAWLPKALKVAGKLGVGTSCVDLLASVASCPNPDDKIKTTSFKVQAGGKTSNALTCAARLRLSLRLISKVADDTQGRAILQELQADSIDTSFIAAWT
ncbi:hypothetical protein ACFX2I_039555 [Malus domestica]